jgi:hypothetical protein
VVTSREVTAEARAVAGLTRARSCRYGSVCLVLVLFFVSTLRQSCSGTVPRIEDTIGYVCTNLVARTVTATVSSRGYGGRYI